jgi:hypothetical protein
MEQRIVWEGLQTKLKVRGLCNCWVIVIVKVAGEIAV